MENSIIAINFVSSKNTDEEHAMHLKHDITEIMIFDKADEVIKELFESLHSRYQIGLEASMKGSDFIFYCINLLHYKCCKLNWKQGESYVDSLAWIKNKNASINSITDDNDKCFQYTATFTLNLAFQQKLSKIALTF